MVALAPLVRRHTFIPDRVLTHGEELAYLWQRRRQSLRSAELPARDFSYLLERIEAHLQGMLVAGAALTEMVEPRLHAGERDEVFAGAWPLLRQNTLAGARRVLEAFAAAKGPAMAGLADTLAVTPSVHTEATLRAALLHGDAPHAAAAAVALASQGHLDPASPRLAALLVAEEGAVAVSAWRAVLHIDPAQPLGAPWPFAEAFRHPDSQVRGAALEVAVWRGEPWVRDAVRRLASQLDPLGLAWLAVVGDLADGESLLAAIASLPGPQRAGLAARLGHPAALETVLAWMSDPDPAVAAAAGEAWARMTGLSVEGVRTELPVAADADPILREFPPEVWLPDVGKAQAQWAEHGPRWRAGRRWRQGFDIESALSTEAQRRIDLEARWDFCARAALAGTRVGAPPPAV